MKKVLFNEWTGLSVRVVSIFAVAMILSFLPNHLREFFGDIKYATPNKFNAIDTEYEWGVRHILYQIMCIILFAIQCIRICVWCRSKPFDKA